MGTRPPRANSNCNGSKPPAHPLISGCGSPPALWRIWRGPGERRPEQRRQLQQTLPSQLPQQATTFQILQAHWAASIPEARKPCEKSR
jgi:hypothetical protein